MPRQSILQDDQAVLKAVSESETMYECLEALGLRAAGGNYKGLRDACARLGIEPPRSSNWRRLGKALDAITIPLDEVLVEGSTYKGGNQFLKRRLIKAGLLEDECAWCALGNEWRRQPLVLPLDHINGVHNDNRIENLRVLCPNCHSQTLNFCGKNMPSER